MSAHAEVKVAILCSIFQTPSTTLFHLVTRHPLEAPRELNRLVPHATPRFIMDMRHFCLLALGCKRTLNSTRNTSITKIYVLFIARMSYRELRANRRGLGFFVWVLSLMWRSMKLARNAPRRCPTSSSGFCSKLLVLDTGAMYF